jgi:hypothetical protein
MDGDEGRQPNSRFAVTLIRTSERPGEPIKYARKTMRRDDDGAHGVTRDYDKVFWWQLKPVGFDDLDDLAAMLSEQMQDGRTAIVAGTPASGLDLDQPQVRRYRPSDRGVTLVEANSPLMVFDFDGIPAPPGLDAVERLRDAAYHAVSRLATAIPEAGFEHAKTVALPTTKSGLVPGLIRLRLMFLLSQGLTGEDKRALTFGLGKDADIVVDDGIYIPTAIIYIARPKFENCDDPIAPEDRIFVIPGRDTVDADALAPAIKKGRKVERAIAAAVRTVGGDWKQLIEKIGSDGHYRHWLKSIVGAAARRGAGENETARAINETVTRMGVPPAKIHEHFEVRDIGRMYRHFASGDQRQREEDTAFERSAMEILDRAAEQVRIEDIEGVEGVEDAVDADPEAEEELRSWLDRLRAAKAKENRNALAYNAGKRLMRFVNAGRLDQDRVLAEIDAALDTWEATP